MSRRRRRRRGRRIAVAVIVLVSLGGSGYALTRSRLFGISRIDVVGSTQRSDVIAASGLQLGQSVMALDLDAAERRVEQLPLVASARVQRDGSLAVKIFVVERRAALEVRSGAERWFVAQDGQIIDVPPAKTVPILLLAEGNTPDGEASAAVLDVWRALPKKVRARIISFEWSEGAIGFMLGTIKITFGRADAIAAKVEAMQRVLARMNDDDLAAIDVRSPRHPAARLR